MARRNRRFNEVNTQNYGKREATQNRPPAGFCEFCAFCVRKYESLWKELQRENGTNGIVNSYLGVTVLVKKGESDKKTINRASADWKSTFAVKHLKQVITSVQGKEDAPCLC